MGNYSWWEKNVEYKFVVDAASAKLWDFAAPMSGVHERTAGDAIFGKDLKLVLVEFKRDKNSIPTEQTLFHNYPKAKELLQDFKHHHIVFGALKTVKNEPTFILVGQRYFIAGEFFPALEVLEDGSEISEFYKYLQALAEQKIVDGRSSGHVSTEGMSTVLGVTSGGQVKAAAALHEYAPTLFPAPASPTPPPPGPKVIAPTPFG